MFVTFVSFMSSQNRRTHDEAFPFDDDDDWIFDPALDRVMIQTGGGSNTRPLLEFELRPVGARRNWRNVLNKQRFEATLRQHRDVTPRDNLGQELTQALQRSIEQQIAQDPTLTPNPTVHFTMQSSAFTHAFQSTTFTVREFEEGSYACARVTPITVRVVSKNESNCLLENKMVSTLIWRRVRLL